jgi:predicted CoA-binding protein
MGNQGEMTMAHENPDLDRLREILTTARTVAVVGASADPTRPSNDIARRLQAAGYRVVPINPRESEIAGEQAYPSLRDVPHPIDIVDVFRRSEDTPPIADEAVQAGAKVFWLQLGVSNEEAARRAEAGGLTVVMDRCIGRTLVELGLASPPKS